MILVTFTAFFMPRCSAIHAWDTVVILHSQTCKQNLSRFGELCSADGEQDIEVLLGRHSSEANEDVGAPIASVRLFVAPPDDQISTIHARPL